MVETGFRNWAVFTLQLSFPIIVFLVFVPRWQYLHPVGTDNAIYNVAGNLKAFKIKTMNQNFLAMKENVDKQS